MSRNRNVQRQAALALSAVLIALPVTAQIESPGYTVNATDIDLSWAPTNVPADGKLELTFWEALEVALRRNYGLVIERYNLEESGLRLMENMGIYDLGFTTDLTGFNETTPSNSNLQGALVQEQEEIRLDFSFSQLNRGGGTTVVDFKNQRFESNSQFAAVNPSFRADVDLTYRQPLLRNMGKLATTRNLIVARNNLDGGQETFEVQVIEVIRTVGLNYWTLVEAREQILVAAESLSLAEGLHEQNKIRVEVGTLAPLELIQSEAGIATRRDEFIRATIDIGNAEDDLREALNVPQGPLWSVEIIPRTAPDITRIEIDTE